MSTPAAPKPPSKEPPDTEPSPSVLWWLAERSSRLWANGLSLLSVSGFTISNGKPPLNKQEFRHLTTREAIYTLSLLGAVLCTFSSLGGILTTQHKWPWIVVVVVATHQIMESFVLMIRLGLFGSHAKYRPTSYAAATRKKRERAVLILMFVYFVAMMWFAAMYRAFEQFDPKNVAVGTDIDGIANPVDVFVLSFSTQTTVGYGTVAPAGLVASVIAAVQSSFGIFFIASAVANMMSLLNVTSTQDNHVNPANTAQPAKKEDCVGGKPSAESNPVVP